MSPWEFGNFSSMLKVVFCRVHGEMNKSLHTSLVEGEKSTSVNDCTRYRSTSLSASLLPLPRLTKGCCRPTLKTATGHVWRIDGVLRKLERPIRIFRPSLHPRFINESFVPLEFSSPLAIYRCWCQLYRAHRSIQTLFSLRARVRSGKFRDAEFSMASIDYM